MSTTPDDGPTPEQRAKMAHDRVQRAEIGRIDQRITDNERWLVTMQALRAVVLDPTRSRADRRKAQDAINAAKMSSGSAGSVLGSYQAGDGIRHTRNGGLVEHGDIDYQGRAER